MTVFGKVRVIVKTKVEVGNSDDINRITLSAILDSFFWWWTLTCTHRMMFPFVLFGIVNLLTYSSAVKFNYKFTSYPLKKNPNVKEYQDCAYPRLWRRCWDCRQIFHKINLQTVKLDKHIHLWKCLWCSAELCQLLHRYKIMLVTIVTYVAVEGMCEKNCQIIRWSYDKHSPLYL